MNIDNDAVQHTVFACGEDFVTMSIPIAFPPHDGETIQAEFVAQMSPARARLFAEKLSHMADLAEGLGQKFSAKTAAIALAETDTSA